MFVNHRTQGFILKKVDRGEVNQLFTIFTKDFGKLEILGKAIRKISSKLRSGAEIFYLSEIEFIQAKTHKTLTDAIVVDKFESVRNDLEKLKISHQIAEIFDELVKGQEKDEALWQLLLETFDKLNTRAVAKGEEEDLSSSPTKYKIQNTIYKIYYFFFWNLLSILGYEPQLYNCALCQKKLEPQKLFFDSKEGGIICQNHDKELKLSNQRTSVLFHPSLRSPFAYRASEGSEGEDEDGVLIARSGKETSPVRKEFSNGVDMETIKILRLILKKDWPLLAKLKIENPHLKALKIISGEYYSYIRNEFVIS